MPISDYAHWNEEAHQVWWAEEGRHAEEPPDYVDYSPEEDWLDQVYEAAFERVLEAVATGASKEDTRVFLVDNYSGLSERDRENLLSDALSDALLQGIEREDIDPSWLR